jgi:hypothetical protein
MNEKRIKDIESPWSCIFQSNLPYLTLTHSADSKKDELVVTQIGVQKSK